jgi:heme oxygenase
MNLREATAEKHKQAERMPFNQKMMRGELTPNEYSAFLRSQHEILSTIEAKFGLPHTGMFTAERILDDLTELGVIDITPPGVVTKKYCDYLKTLDYDTILPHIYLNYMALMMGGQILKKLVPGSGRMYDFGSEKDRKDYVQIIRNHQKDDWVDEVNCGYDFVISILDELNNEKYD